MFDESKVKRDKDGKFSEKDGEQSYNEFMEALKEEEIRNYNTEKKPEDISGLLGQEYEGFKGQEAVNKLLQEKQGHVKGAFRREDIGDIDLLWGNDDIGLQHIIARRTEQNIDTAAFLGDVTDTIEKGTYRKKNERGNFEFMHNGKVAIIAPELKGNKITFLLTAFKTHSKK